MLGTAVVFAQQKYPDRPTGDEYWYVLKSAETAYSDGNYGMSLALAQEAKNKRKNQTAWESSIIDQALRSSKIRFLGDNLAEVLPVLKESYTSVYNVIYPYIDIYGESYFHGSFNEFRTYLKNNEVYPEADYLIGKIYIAEGEPEFATQYLNKAVKSYEVLDVPDVKYDILYTLSEIALSQINYDGLIDYVNASKAFTENYFTDYEKYLLNILDQDEYFKDDKYTQAMIRIIHNNKKDSVDKFFILYRNNDDISIRALQQLSSYYFDISSILKDEKEVKVEREKALKCSAMACIIAVTRIEEILKDRITGYSYTTLEDLLSRCVKYRDIVAWGNDNNIWQEFNNLAFVADQCGYKVFSNTLYNILMEKQPVEYWRKKAASYAIKPQESFRD